VLTRRHLGSAGLYNPNTLEATQRVRLWWRFSIGAGILAVALLAFALGWIVVAPVTLAHAAAALIVAMSVLYFAFYLLFGGLTREERARGIVLVVLFLGSAAFWAGYEQAGSSLNLFAERYTDRYVSLLHFTIPTEWFQSLNPFYIVVFAPAFAGIWVALARRHLDPSAPAKFAIGVILMGSGFLLMVAASTLVAGGSKVSPNWLIFTYLLHTFGELCLSPVGLSYFTKLTPKRFVGQMMGMFFLSISLGNLAAGLIAGEFDAENLAAMPGQYLHIVYFSVGLGLVLLILSKPVKKLMGALR
jgi:POT family proton-dependent oligopeptide transporter